LTAQSNSSFQRNLQIAWDSTSLGALKTCPRYYYYTIVCGYQTKTQSHHLTFGILYHKGIEVFEHGKAAGKSYEDSVDDALSYLLRNTWEKGRPWHSGDSNKNRETLIRSVLWYLEEFKDDSLRTIILANGKPAVELSFRFDTSYSASSGRPYILCGHLDRLASFDGDIYIPDHKTTQAGLNSYFFEKFTPDNQVSLYSLGAKITYHQPVVGVIISGAQILVESTRFAREYIQRTESQLDEWYDELGDWLDLAERFAATGRYPMNEKSCSNYGGCPFRKVCSMPPAARQPWLENDFAKRIWDPLQIRGDI